MGRLFFRGGREDKGGDTGDRRRDAAVPEPLHICGIPCSECGQYKKYGRIINISSISSKRGTPYLYTYSATKAALDSLTQSIASTASNYGFTINSICPGGIDTNMSINGRIEISNLKNMKDNEYQNGMINEMCLGKLIPTKSVVYLIDYLLSEEANCISGQSINICGALEVK